MRLPSSCLIVLVGPSGAGKSRWAAEHFRPEQVVSSDGLRALVGTGDHDQRAGTDAFDVLDLVLERRLARRLLTVVDTLGLDAGRRRQYVDAAHRHGVPCHAVVFDTAADTCRTRNRARSEPVPAKVLTAQLAARDEAVAELHEEEFDGVHVAGPVEIVPAELVDAPVAAARQRTTPVSLSFGLQLSSFARQPAGTALAPWLADIATTAEAVGFSSIWVMDHLMQIPQLGRPWEDMPEAWTTLAWLAGCTRTARLGTLVTGVTLRNPAHLAKIVATLDVLSGGRVVCGLGAAWWEHEHHLYGWRFPPLAERYDLLEDALQLLPLMWGPGSPPFEGKATSVAETLCYPRPQQEHVPILVGGSGERTTLRLAATYADACNLRGDPATVRHKVAVLAEHCRHVGRDPAQVGVTHLSTALVAPSRRELRAAVDRHRPRSSTPEEVGQRLGAGTVDEHIGRYRELAEAGVQTAIVSLPDLATPGSLEAFGQVIAAFADAPPSAAL
ncbi:MAG TPA: TIGR03560 family F420-dependent LLM class oxidoreductase [Acidimicrobiales bacterium]|nr:TIGR03560 family F420-dependent LLM class oxidoreductase [Acidimicrobiales bacterium]